MHAQFHHVSLLASWSRKPIILYKIVRLTFCQKYRKSRQQSHASLFLWRLSRHAGSLVTFLSCPY